MPNGVIIIDKPKGMTSHDVVAVGRRIFAERSIGHLGTLDPMATGVLPLVLGRFTRLAQFYGDATKGYDGEIRFGFATDTYDAEGQPQGPEKDVSHLTLELIREAAAEFLGSQQQVPPAYSAKKVEGVRSYKLARSNREVELQAVQITVQEFEILDYADGRARFRSVVSSGTYIRCLAHDLGNRLGIGAHLSILRRTRVGEFALEDARTLDEFSSDPTLCEQSLIHPRRILPEMPSVTVTDEVAGYIRNGRAVNLLELSDAKLVKVFINQRELLAVASRVAGTLFHSKVVLYGNNEMMPMSGVRVSLR
jgi:tRNA pseudouridine55 synthase